MNNSQEYLGKNQLVKRLSSQVGSYSMAIDILIKRGDVNPDGKSFTPKGEERNAMTAEERAISRAQKKSGGNSSDYTYNQVTNQAKLNY